MNTRLAAKSGRLCIGLLIAAACLPALRTKSDEPAKTEKAVLDSMLGKEAGEVRDDNGLKMKLVWCPPGAFLMGCADNLTTRTFLTRGYWIGKYELTQSQWASLMESEPLKDVDSEEVADDHPATELSWRDAMRFCRTLTEQERLANRLPPDWEYTLPTEAQWERACRGRTDTKYSFGDDESLLAAYAWFLDNSEVAGKRSAHCVGQKKPNPWGIHDMYGNVWEWCLDVHAKEIPGGRDPFSTKGTPGDHTIRGGGWSYEVEAFRWQDRLGLKEGSFQHDLGFRVALTPVRPAK